MDQAAADRPLKWYQGLERYCWVVLVISALGWLFDTMDQNLFNLVRKPSLGELLRKEFTEEQLKENPKLLRDEVDRRAGHATSIFLIGWAVGGFFFGVVGDRWGRTKTMIATILIYAVSTGASGLVHSWGWYALTRFTTALGVGGEWAAGAALVAEVFPARSRPMALGFLQSLSSFGNMTASIITLGLADLDHRWRWAYFIGAAPALLVLWIRTAVKEPEKWKEAASLGKEMGNMGELFIHPVLRRNTIAAILMATAGVGALWGVAFFSPDLLHGELRASVPDNAVRGRMVSLIFLVQNLGAFFGIYSFAVFAERFSRRAAFGLWFVLAWVSLVSFFWGVSGSGNQAFTRAMFLAPVMGFCTLGPFSGYTVYFPELFPTRLRTTGCGLCYNAARILAAAAPFLLGEWGRQIGLAKAATIISSIYLLGFVGAFLGPETKGKPLPEDKDFEKQASPAPALERP